MLCAAARTARPISLMTLPPPTPPPPNAPPAAPLRPAARHASLWRALASLLVSLVAVAGWQLSEAGKEPGRTRSALATQTTPVLPELRPVPPPPVSFAGLGGTAEALLLLPAPRSGRSVRLTRPASVARTPGLTVLGRMNLDGG